MNCDVGYTGSVAPTNASPFFSIGSCWQDCTPTYVPHGQLLTGSEHDTVTVQCDAGRSSTTLVTSCLGTGLFESVVCTRNWCVPTSVPKSDRKANASITGQSGDLVDITCDVGYNCSAQPCRATCLATGNFSHISCIPQACQVTEAENSDHAASGSITGATGETRTLICDASYGGAGGARCLSSGRFETDFCSACTATSVMYSDKAVPGSIVARSLNETIGVRCSKGFSGRNSSTCEPSSGTVAMLAQRVRALVRPSAAALRGAETGFDGYGPLFRTNLCSADEIEYANCSDGQNSSTCNVDIASDCFGTGGSYRNYYDSSLFWLIAENRHEENLTFEVSGDQGPPCEYPKCVEAALEEPQAIQWHESGVNAPFLRPASPGIELDAAFYFGTDLPVEGTSNLSNSPSSAPQILDDGSGFRSGREQNFSYGWDCSGDADVTYAGGRRSADRDGGLGLNHFDFENTCPGRVNWQVAVPMGAYSVEVDFGEGNDTTACEVEGTRICPVGGNCVFKDIVMISDGFFTITGDSFVGGGCHSVSFVRVTGVNPSPLRRGSSAAEIFRCFSSQLNRSSSLRMTAQ